MAQICLQHFLTHRLWSHTVFLKLENDTCLLENLFSGPEIALKNDER